MTAISSKTDIGNLTLDLLSSAIVTDIENGQSATEAILNRWYDHTRRKLLREHAWNFATKRGQIAASSTDPLFGYEKAYTLPADFIRLCYIQDDAGNILGKDRYSVEGGSILMNGESSPINIVYVYDIEDVSRFDPLFVELFAYDLAIAIAYKISESAGNIEKLEFLKKDRKMIARAIDGQEKPPIRRQVSTAINARRTSSTSDAHRIIF